MMFFTVYVIIAVIFFIGSSWVEVRSDPEEAWICFGMAIVWPLTILAIILFLGISGWQWLRRWFATRRRVNGLG